MTFGETVKAERVKRGWSQQRLANLAGMNRSHIGGIETKPGLPQYATITSIAKAFGMTPPCYNHRIAPGTGQQSG